MISNSVVRRDRWLRPKQLSAVFRRLRRRMTQEERRAGGKAVEQENVLFYALVTGLPVTQMVTLSCFSSPVTV